MARRPPSRRCTPNLVDSRRAKTTRNISGRFRKTALPPTVAADADDAPCCHNARVHIRGGSMTQLTAAVLAFVGGHFLLSSPPLRRPVAARVGEVAFSGLYSALMLAAFVWMVTA